MAASWECPSLPMLSFPMKESGRASFLGIKPMISAHYEEDPESFNEEVRQLDQLREHAMRPSRDYGGCSVLRRYFAQLHLLRARFPPDTGQLPIDFVWKDAFTGAEYIQEGLQIEQASVLYNLCALHSQLGCHGRRDTEQEMKEAVTHFQCAAGVTTYLEEHLAVNNASRDLSPQFVAVYKNLMLGQAQECLVEKSLKGVGRVKNITISKLASRVTEYYTQVHRSLEVDPCNVISKKHKDWARLLKIKIHYFQAVSHFFQATHAEEMGKYGEVIGYQQLALHKLSTMGKIPRNLGDVVKEAVKNLEEHLQVCLQTSRKQNDQVYHEVVPIQETLETTQGADLVKPVTFYPADSRNLGTDILARLVPMRAYEIASVYSEEAAKLQRSIMSSVQEKNEELEQFMTSLNVGEIDKLHAGPPEIPSEVKQQHQVLQGNGETIKNLQTNIQELMSLSDQVSEDLEVIAAWRKEDTEEEEELQARFGMRPKSQVCATLWKDLESYQAFHSQASKSNSELKAMFDQHYQHLVLLSGPLSGIEAVLPKMTPMDTPAMNTADMQRWKELLDKVEQMKKQRSSCLARLREQISSDDITKSLIGHLGSDQSAFIEEHMKKHRDVVDIIRQNLTAQDKILTALTEENAKQAKTRRAVQELSKQQQGVFKSLMKSGSYLPLLQSKIQEGVGFYTRLHGNVTKLKKRTVELCGTRRKERQSTVQRQSTPASDQSAPPPPPPADHDTPAHPPQRPPKKPELSGRPLPPEQQKLPPEIPLADESASCVSGHFHQAVSSEFQQPSSLPSGITSSSGQSVASQPDVEQQLQELQRLHEIQMQQLKQSEAATSQLPNSTPLVPNEEVQPAPHPQGLPQDAIEAQQLIQQTMPATGELLAPMRVERVPLSDDTKFNPPADMSRNHLSEGLQNGTTQPQLPPSNNELQQQDLGAKEATRDLQQPTGHLQGDDTPDAGPEVNQALLNLQMLLQPPEDISQPSSLELLHPVHPHQFIEASSTTLEAHDEAPSLHLPAIPQRPLKPQHLQSKPKQHPSSPASSSYASAPDSQVSTPGSEIPSSQPPFEQPSQKDIELTAPPLEPYRPTSPLGGKQVTPSSMQTPSNQPPPSIPEGTAGQSNSLIPHQEGGNWSEELKGLPPQEGRIPLSSGFVPFGEVAPPPFVAENTVTVDSFSRPIPAVQSPMHSEPMNGIPDVQSKPPDDSVPFQSQDNSIPEPREAISLSPPSESLPPPSESLPPSQVPPPAAEPSLVASSTITCLSASSQGPFGQLAADAFAGLKAGSMAVTSADAMTSSLTDVTQVSAAISGKSETVSELEVAPLKQVQLQPSASLPIQVPSTTTHELPVVSLGLEPLHTLDPTTIDTHLASLPISVYQPTAAPLSVPLSVPPLPQELSAPLTDLQSVNTAHFEALLSSQQDTIHERSRQVEEQKQQINNQGKQIEDQKKQIIVLQQQVAQLSMLQQKQEQDKAAASGQQAVLMQLLQQQQGMFSQQQLHIEKLSDMGESHRKEQMELEINYKQALAVEQEQKSTLQKQVMEQNQEIQKLTQQLQSQAQQYQNLQLQLHQYNTQIQERDKQLTAFRDQHKQIVQTLDQRHQQKVGQLMEHIQKLQAEVKRNRVELQRVQSLGGGLPPPLQPVQARPIQPQPQYQPPGVGAPQGLQSFPQPLQPTHPNQPPHQPILQPTRVSPQPPTQGAVSPHPNQPLSRQQHPPPQQHQPPPQQHQPPPQQHQPPPQQHQPPPQQHQPPPQQHHPPPQQHQPPPQQHQPPPQQHQPPSQQHQSQSQHPQTPQWSEGRQRQDSISQQPFSHPTAGQQIQQTHQPQHGPLPLQSQPLPTPQGQLQHSLHPHAPNVRGPHLPGQPTSPGVHPAHSQTHPGLTQGIPQQPPIPAPGNLPSLPSQHQPGGPVPQGGQQQPVQHFQPQTPTIAPGQMFPQPLSGPALQPRIVGSPGQPANFSPSPQQQVHMQQPRMVPTSSLNLQVPSSQGFQPPRQQ